MSTAAASVLCRTRGLLTQNVSMGGRERASIHLFFAGNLVEALWGPIFVFQCRMSDRFDPINENADSFSNFSFASPRKSSACFTKVDFGELKRARLHTRASSIADPEVRHVLSPSRLEIPPDAPLLPVLPSRADCIGSEIWQISPDTVNRLLGRDIVLDAGFEIIDCRFSYEHDGGHIYGAGSCPTTEALMSWLFPDDEPAVPTQKCVILHCEHSECRAPTALRRVQQRSQQVCAFDDEHFTVYPQLYVISGGYAKFFSTYPRLCDGGYVKCRPEDEQAMKTTRSSLNLLSISCEDALLTRSFSLDTSRSTRPASRRSLSGTPRSFDFSADAFDQGPNDRRR